MTTMVRGSATVAGFFSQLKEDYHDSFEEAINDRPNYYNWLDDATDKVEIGGKGLFWPVLTARPGSVGAIAENANAPSPGIHTAPQASATEVEIWGTFQLTKRVMGLAKKNAWAFADVFTLQGELIERGCMESMDRQLIGNVQFTAKNGVICQNNNTTGPGTTITVDNGNTHSLFPGMPLWIGTDAELVADPITAVAATVESITNLTTFETTAAITIVNDDLVTVGGEEAGNTNQWGSYNQEMTGLYEIVNNAGTVYGIDPTTTMQGAWTSVLNSNSGTVRSASKGMFTGMFTQVALHSGRKPNAIVCHDYGRDTIQDVMEADVRYEAQTFRGGYVHDTFVWNNGEANIPFIVTKHVRPNDFFFLRKDAFGIAWNTDWGWLDDHGSKLRFVSRKTSFESMFGCIAQQICFERSCSGKLTDVKLLAGLTAVPN